MVRKRDLQLLVLTTLTCTVDALRLVDVHTLSGARFYVEDLKTSPLFIEAVLWLELADLGE